MEKTTGTLPISIATSLALEGALGIHPDIPENKRTIDDYKNIWFNLRTLARNTIGCLSETSKSDPIIVGASLEEDLIGITEILSKETLDRVKPIFFVSEYDGLESKYPYALLRKDNTENQKYQTVLINRAVQMILEKHKNLSNLKVFKLKIKGEELDKSLIVTHAAYDLVAHRCFKHLDLLESHTGIIKPRSQWYTKYTDGKNLARIPFREDMLQIFGDAYLFRPMDIKLRKDILDIAETYNWTSITTTDKIRYGINQMKNEYFKKVVNAILVN